MIHWVVSRTIHITFGSWQRSSSMHKPREQSITAVSYLSIPDIQTHELNFDIPHVQQNSFTAETDLIQP